MEARSISPGWGRTLADVPHHWRLALAWKLLFAAYLGLAFVSVAILRHGFDLNTADGRHLLAGALANLALVWMSLFIVATGYCAGRRWAWLACLACLYGLPVMIIDARKFRSRKPHSFAASDRTRAGPEWSSAPDRSLLLIQIQTGELRSTRRNHIAASAMSRSAMMSPSSSMPTEMRTMPSVSQ